MLLPYFLVHAHCRAQFKIIVFAIRAERHAYSAAISTCEKGFPWHEALEILSEMQGHRLEPSIATCSAAISTFEQGSQWHEAAELLSEM